jgi:iron(III) transport system ATP-binding protein
MTYDVFVEDLTIDYGRVRAVDGVSFGIEPGELVTLLGPSGCGKTSILRAIAGLERNSGGKITIAGDVVSDAATKTFLAPERRNIGMVFQSYALWPHMTVAEAVGYPLRRRKVPKAQHHDRVMKTLATVGMEQFANRRVPELSGGQQQRVAIARALVYEPRILLLDEPLSNLDANLRERMRIEIKELQSRVGITTLCVTHDQTEALAMSHRVIVMQAGRIEQIGTPVELYENPRTRFASESLGKVNALACRVTSREKSTGVRDRVRAEIVGTGLTLEAWTVHEAVAAGDMLQLIIRPERVELFEQAPMQRDNVVEGVVASCVFGGDHREYRVAFGSGEIIAKADARIVLSNGQRMYVHLPADDLMAVPDDRE